MTQNPPHYPTREEIEQCMLEAKKDNAVAQYQLGICYANGYGVTIDRKLAVKHFCDAAERGHAEALYQLGICHYYGYGVPSNQSQAAEFWEVAANTGHAEAQYQLGNCYYYGNGVDAHRGRAKHWSAKTRECSTTLTTHGWCSPATIKHDTGLPRLPNMTR